MHATDVEHALLARDLPALQQAFCALVDPSPHSQAPIEHGASATMVLLGRVLIALRHDRHHMPAETCQAIETVCLTRLLPQATYAHGARVVADHRESWQALYRAHATDDAC